MNFDITEPVRVGPAFQLALALVGLWCTPAVGQETSGGSGLTLSSAVARALANHPEALAADANVNAAAASIGEATALRLPQLAFEGSATRYQEPMIVAPLHALDMTRAPDFDRTLLRGTATVAYTLFDGGVRGSRIRGSRAEAGAAEANRESARASLISKVTSTYLQVLTVRDVLSAHDTLMSALAAELDRAQQLYAEGTVARVVVLRAEAAIAQAEADRVATAAALEVAEQDLARLIGADPPETESDKLIAVSLVQESANLDRESLLVQATASNPELLRAREHHKASLASKKAASAMWLPNVSLFGGYLGFGSGAGDLVTEWQGGAKVTYPIFTGGARSKTNARASAQVELARQTVRQAELAVSSGVDLSMSAVRETHARLEAISEAVTHLSEVTRIEKLTLETGAGTQTEYLRSEAELLRARATLIEARNRVIVSRVELARVTGQLNPDWLGRELENTP